ncbi:MAG: hypothetical protein ACTHOU_03820 [Aureliella sp.]
MLALACAWAPRCHGQLLRYPQPSSGLRDIQTGRLASSSQPVMVPLNPATQNGLYPSTSTSGATFDPYATRPSFQNPGYQLPSTSSTPPVLPYGTSPASPVYPNSSYPGTSYPGTSYPSTSGGMFGNPPPATYSGAPLTSAGGAMPATTFPPSVYPGAAVPGTGYPNAAYPGTAYPGGLNPAYPGLGQSGSLGTFNGGPPAITPPGMYPNSTPPSLFPTSIFGGGLFGTALGPPYGTVNNGGILAPGAVSGASPYGTWNPQGNVAGVWPSQPPFIRFFQGPRFRHAYIYGDNDPNSLQIHDTDLSLAFAVPNFLFSTQPIYILPSFSLHQWDGPNAPSPADLPSKAYSAFLDTGWQSDPLRLVGAELGVRVGVFSDFNTFTSDSIRVMGRGLGRIRLTPTATLKGGIVYLDRNRVKLLPAGGVLWQPNPGTRFDLFFPEPKLSHYLNTVGTYDTWWYVGGYYGGGAWTVERTSGAKDSIDINDIRLLLGLEWGRNEQMREGRRVGFFEVGYVFNRELLYKNDPADNIDLADSFVLRAGLGY